jgi:hypothetical protein
MLDTDDDRIYFTGPDKLDTITIDVSKKRTGSSAYKKEFRDLQYNQKKLATAYPIARDKISNRP